MHNVNQTSACNSCAVNSSQKNKKSQWQTLQKGQPVLFAELVSKAGQVMALFVILLASYKAS